MDNKEQAGFKLQLTELRKRLLREVDSLKRHCARTWSSLVTSPAYPRILPTMTSRDWTARLQFLRTKSCCLSR